jgi:hypothetical protein
LQDVQRIMVANIEEVLQRGEALSGVWKHYEAYWEVVLILYARISYFIVPFIAVSFYIGLLRIQFSEIDYIRKLLIWYGFFSP